MGVDVFVGLLCLSLVVVLLLSVVGVSGLLTCVVVWLCLLCVFTVCELVGCCLCLLVFSRIFWFVGLRVWLLCLLCLGFKVGRGCCLGGLGGLCFICALSCCVILLCGGFGVVVVPFTVCGLICFFG